MQLNSTFNHNAKKQIMKKIQATHNTGGLKKLKGLILAALTPSKILPAPNFFQTTAATRLFVRVNFLLNFFLINNKRFTNSFNNNFIYSTTRYNC